MMIERRIPQPRRPRAVSRPSSSAIRSRTAFERHLREEHGEWPPDDDVLADWDDHFVPGSKRPVYLPRPESDEWYTFVDELGTARLSWDSGGPMTREQAERICCSGEVYFVVTDRDGDYSIDVVGQFREHEAGLRAVVAASSGFVIGPENTAVAFWVDEENDGIELGDDTYDDDTYDEDDRDDDDTYDDDRDEDDDEDDRDEDDGDDEGTTAWARLVMFTIVHESGVVLAGEGASTALPSDDEWWVVPTSDDLHESLADHLRDVGRGALASPDGARTEVSIFDRIQTAGVIRVAAAWGIGEVHRLTHDSIEQIDVARESITARALRVR